MIVRLNSKLLFAAFVFAVMSAAAIPSMAWADPSPTPSAQGAGTSTDSTGEMPETTKDAKAVYAQLVNGKVDRSKMSEQLNNALTDQVVTSLSGQLAGFGDPSWHFVKNVATAKGSVSVYRLSKDGHALFFNFGETSDHIVWNLLLAADK